MLNIPTTEMISVQFDVLVYYILFALIMGIAIGFKIRELLSKYRIVNIQPNQIETKNENISTKL